MNNNIQESYCSFEVSKLLQSKGFNVPCRKAYMYRFLEHTYDTYKGVLIDAPLICDIYAPTHALAIEWIRVNFGIWISVFNDDVNFFWMGIILNTKERIRGDNGEEFNTPQEATEAALLYTLNKLI